MTACKRCAERTASSLSFKTRSLYSWKGRLSISVDLAEIHSPATRTPPVRNDQAALRVSSEQRNSSYNNTWSQMDHEYQAGGTFGAHASRVMENTGCQREQAIAALKVCDNIVDVAIACLSDPWLFPSRTQDHTRIPPPVASLHEEGDGEGDGLTPPESLAGDAPEIDRRQGDPELYPLPPPQPHQPSPAPTPSDLLNSHFAELGNTTSNRPSNHQTSILPGIRFSSPVPIISPTLLPRLKPAGSTRAFRPRESVGGRFSIERVVWALQTKQVTHAELQKYFSHLAEDQISQNINKEIEGVPAIFYAVETGEEEILHTWIKYGGDVNARRGPNSQPLLAFAMLLAESLRSDTTGIVVSLLASGAEANVIPKEFYTPVLQGTLVTAVPAPILGPPADSTGWCTRETRSTLLSSINITQKYHLHQNATRKKPSTRLQHAASQLKIQALFGLPYKMVGQSIAVQQLLDELLSYLATRSQRPLVLFFSGPSGHGKSELSKLLGAQLSLPWLSVDMAGIKRETDLFGPKAPFYGHQEGSPLNNFISHHSGKRVIVFLDEFERSSKEVWDALLLPFDEGAYVDHRTSSPIDASKVIWILASNALDPILKDVLKNHDLNICSNLGPLSRELQSRLSKELRSQFGYPLAGRISSIVPFLPFSKVEQAVMAHKILLRLTKTVRAPVSLPDNLVGNVNFQIRHDTAVCVSLADSGYDVDTGARSLESAIARQVKTPLVQRYMDGHHAVDENQAIEDYILDVDRNGNIMIVKSSE